jgi:hypothetical protein
MRIRPGATAGVLLFWALTVPALPAVAADDPVGPSLTLDVPATVPGGHVVVDGSCSPPLDDVGLTTSLTLGGRTVADVVQYGQDGTFSKPAPITAPSDLPAGATSVESECGGSTPFTVLEAPLLTVAPDQAGAGDEVTITGTCRLAVFELLRSPVELVLDGDRVLATASLDDRTGALEPLTFALPDDVPPGGHELRSSCDGIAALTVPATEPSGSSTPNGSPSVSSSPASPSADALVTVPNLLNLTEDEAVVALGGDLRLGDVQGSGGRIVAQLPQPGELVPRDSSVAVVLGVVSGDDASPLTAWLVAAAALAVLAAVVIVLLLRVRPSARGKRRVRDARYEVELGEWAVPDALPEPRPHLDVRLRVELEPERLHFQEVGDGR